MEKRYNTTTLAIAYLTGGTPVLDQAIKDARTTYETIKKMILLLKKQDSSQAAAAEAWYGERVTDRVQGLRRGRSVPVKGESRSYKVQKTALGTQWIRLPVDVLGGDLQKVRVSYSDNKIVVKISTRTADKKEAPVETAKPAPTIRMRRN